MKICCNVWNKYRKSKKNQTLSTLKNTISLSITYSKCDHEYEKIFKEEISIEILKFLGLIANIEEYNKIHNHV